MSIQQRPGRVENFIVHDLLCDDNGSFIRIYVRNSNNVLIDIDDYELDGSTPYVVSGQVYKCDNLRLERSILCDDNGSFFRLFLYDSATGALQNIYDYDLDNNPYVTNGAIIDCAALEYVSAVLCDDDAQFVRRYEYTAGVLTQFLDYDFGGNPYNPNGPVRTCESERNHREILCDDNGQFLRTYLFAPDNTPIGVLDYEIENLAVYVPQGIVHTCVDINDMFMNMCGYDSANDQTVSFIRRIQFVGLTFGNIQDYDVNGNPYNSGFLDYIVWGECEYNVTESIVCADGATTIKRTVTVNSNDIDTFIVEDGGVVVPTNWYPGGCGTNGELDVVMCGFEFPLTFVSFIRRYQFDNLGNIINVENYDTSGALYDPSALTNVQYGGCGHLTVVEEKYCLTVLPSEELLDLIKITVYANASPQFIYWMDTSYVIQPPPNLADLRAGTCINVDTNCDLQAQIVQFCDSGNANQVFYEVSLFTLTQFSTLNSWEVDAGGNIYVPVGPVIICPGSATNLFDGSPTQFQNLLGGLFTNVVSQGILNRCPVGTINVNGKYLIDYPSWTFRQVGVNGSVTEVEVCADGVPAIRRVIGAYDDIYLQEVEFIGTDGTILNPTTWSPGRCADLANTQPVRQLQAFFFIIDDTSQLISSLGTLKEINVLKVGGGSSTIATANFSQSVTSAGNVVYKFVATEAQEFLSDNFTITDVGAGTTRIWGLRAV